MEIIDAHSLTAMLALIGIVILVSALLSGLIERSRFPQVAVFLALGAALGPSGLGSLDLTLDSPAVRIASTLSLTLVLFTDAVTLNVAEVRRHSGLALLVLGPGTLLSAALVALVAWWLLGLSLAAAAILGAALASTDPVLLRGVLNGPDLPATARQALRLESGLNDVVLLPVVLVAMPFLDPSTAATSIDWARVTLSLFVLGPGAGIAVGLLAIAALDLVRRQLGVRRDYESLYSLGVAFTAYAAAESVHGSGFLAAFAAGLTIAALDVDLCDCFVDYGATTAEMALLLTFVLFGGSLIWRGLTVLSGATLAFAVIVLLIRPPVFLVSLIRSGVDPRDRLLIAWFGPRGLSSLLLVLLPVFAGLPGSEHLFAICCLVVLLSIVLHGGSPLLLARRAHEREQDENILPPKDFPVPLLNDKDLAPVTSQFEAEGKPLLSNASPMFSAKRTSPKLAGALDVIGGPADTTTTMLVDPVRISVEELQGLWQRGEQIVLLDVRSVWTYNASAQQARGAVRLSPDHPVGDAATFALPPSAWLIAYCA
jgi:sodium/hydrogen antiporter